MKTTKELVSKVLLRQSALPFYSGYTYYHHLRTTLVMAVGAGLMALNGYVLQKGLAATDSEMAIYTTVTGIPYLLTPVWSQFFRRHGTRGTLSRTPFIEAAPILLMAFAWLPWQFIMLTGINVLAATAILPVQNFAMQQNYAVSLRGRIFGQLSAYWLLVLLSFAFIAALIMDLPAGGWNIAGRHEPQAWRCVFPPAAVLCFIGRFIFRRLRVRSEKIILAPARKKAQGAGYIRNLITSYGEVLKVFRNDRHFFMYEMGFILYGTAIIMITPIVPIVANVNLKMTYMQFFMATILVSNLVQMPLGPVWGTIMDKLKGPRTSLSIYCILIVSMVILWWAVSVDSMWLLAAGFIVQGVGMAGINITWNLGSVEFSRRGEVDRYTSAHVFLVGLRFCYAPALGVAIMMLLKGAQWVFLCGTVTLAAACVMMIFLRRSMVRAQRAAA